MATKTIYTFSALKDFRVRTVEGKKDVKKGEDFEVTKDIADMLKKNYKRYCKVSDVVEEEVTKKGRDLGVSNSSAFDSIDLPEGEDEGTGEDGQDGGDENEEGGDDQGDDNGDDDGQGQDDGEDEGSEETEEEKRARLFEEAVELEIPANKIPSNISTEKLEAKVEEARKAGEEK